MIYAVVYCSEQHPIDHAMLIEADGETAAQTKAWDRLHKEGLTEVTLKDAYPVTF